MIIRKGQMTAIHPTGAAEKCKRRVDNPKDNGRSAVSLLAEEEYEQPGCKHKGEKTKRPKPLT